MRPQNIPKSICNNHINEGHSIIMGDQPVTGNHRKEKSLEEGHI